MHRILTARRAAAFALLLALLMPLPARADRSFADVFKEVNPKMVKLFGSGGFRGLVAYGTGILVSADGYILTVSTPMLDTADLRVHLYDGRRYHAKVVVVEPALEMALVKIDTKEEGLDLPHFDIAAAAKRPLAKTATGVLAFSNQFEIATRDEPMSVQRGLIAAYTKLQGRRGIHEAAFKDNVYVVDAITNNPGAAGGALTTRDGKLLGLIGKELKNELTNTWLNYAIPIQTAVAVTEEGGKKRTVSIAEVVEKKEKYVASKGIDRNTEKAKNYTGLFLVPDVVELTPPFVEAVVPGSPAEKAGLQPDDLIVYVNGEQVASIKELNELLSYVRPKNKVQLEVRRGDKLTTLTLEMGAPPKKGPKR